MSDKNEVIEAEIVEEQQPEKEAKVSDTEQEALSKGWVPEDKAIERGMAPEEAVDAKTFLDREPFIKRIKLLDQRNRTLSQKMDQILGKFDQAELQGYERAIQELETERDMAFDDLDSKKVRELETMIDDQKKKATEAQQRQHQVKINDHPEATEFVSKNQEWWQKDIAATQYAAVIEQKVMVERPGIDPAELYNIVQEEVDRFRGKKTTSKPKASYVAPPTRASGSSGEDKSYGFNDLTSDARDVYMSMKTYYQDEFQKDYPVAEFIKAQTEHGLVTMDELVRK